MFKAFTSKNREAASLSPFKSRQKSIRGFNKYDIFRLKEFYGENFFWGIEKMNSSNYYEIEKNYKNLMKQKPQKKPAFRKIVKENRIEQIEPKNIYDQDFSSGSVNENKKVDKKIDKKVSDQNINNADLNEEKKHLDNVYDNRSLGKFFYRRTVGLVDRFLNKKSDPVVKKEDEAESESFDEFIQKNNRKKKDKKKEDKTNESKKDQPDGKKKKGKKVKSKKKAQKK